MENINKNIHLISVLLAIILMASITFSSNLAMSSSVIIVPDDYPTIQEAINAAHGWDTILVKAGQYNESITIDKPLNLTGEDKKTTIIDGNYNMTVVLVQANHVNISGFTIQNSRTDIIAVATLASRSAAGGIALLESGSNIITNNTIQACIAGVAICPGSSNNIVRDNTVIRGDLPGIAFTAYGVWDFFGAGYNTISNNNLSGVNYGIGVGLGAGNEVITGNRVEAGFPLLKGIWLVNSTHNTLENNIVSGAAYSTGGGISFEEDCNNNILDNNKISNGTRGIWLYKSGGNILRRNSLYNNTYNFGVEGSDLSDYINDIDTSNTIDGKPIYYLLNQTDLDINPRTWPEIGFLGLINSKNINVWRLSMIENIQGLLMAQVSNSEIAECYFTNHQDGIYFWNCSGNTIMGNTIISSGLSGIRMTNCENNIIRGNTLLENTLAVVLTDSKDNTFHRNNFLYSTQVEQVDPGELSNIWDDRNSFPGPFPCPICGDLRPVGNYWSDYTGLDDGLHTQEHNCPGDGIGDTGLPCHEVDYHPLMRPWVPVFGDLDYNGIVNIIDISNAARNFGKTSP